MFGDNFEFGSNSNTNTNEKFNNGQNKNLNSNDDFDDFDSFEFDSDISKKDEKENVTDKINDNNKNSINKEENNKSSEKVQKPKLSLIKDVIKNIDEDTEIITNNKVVSNCTDTNLVKNNSNSKTPKKSIIQSPLNINKPNFNFYNSETVSCEHVEFLDNNYWKGKHVLTDEIDLLIKEIEDFSGK